MNDLYVGIAEESSHSAHPIANCYTTGIRITQSHCIVQLRYRCCRVANNVCSVYRIGTFRGFHILPCPPRTVNLCVMEEKVWVARRGKEIRPWIASYREMACGVNSHEVVCKRWVTSLHITPERLDVWAVEEFHNHLICRPLTSCPGGDIPLEAARVVSKAEVRTGGIGDRIRWCASMVSQRRTEIDRPILERARGNTASSCPVWNLNCGLIVRGDAVECLILACEGTVAAHRRGGTV